MKLNQRFYAYLMLNFEPSSFHVSRGKLYAYFIPKIFSKKGNPQLIKSGTSAQLYDDILYFSRNSSVKGCCFCFSQEWLFSILFIFIRKSMQWTREHDILLCREALALEVYKHKKGTNEAGRLCQTVRFKSNLSQRAVRERFNLIQGRFKENEKIELAASGISAPEQDELDVLFENIAERERDAIDIRNQALERMGQTKKRKSEDGQEPKERKSRRSSNEALQFMQEKAESDKAFREEELKIRKKEEETKAAQFQAMFTQQQSFLQAMTQQQAQQQQQNQHMQMLMAQQSQAMMSVLEKLLSKE